MIATCSAVEEPESSFVSFSGYSFPSCSQDTSVLLSVVYLGLFSLQDHCHGVIPKHMSNSSGGPALLLSTYTVSLPQAGTTASERRAEPQVCAGCTGRRMACVAAQSGNKKPKATWDTQTNSGVVSISWIQVRIERNCSFLTPIRVLR